MHHRFDPYARDYRSLSVKDLLEAREAYHVHLTHLDNVFATAIGLYGLRDNLDPDAKDYQATRDGARRRGKLGPRTLENSVVRPWSWPCVLVFVRKWVSPQAAARHRDQIVPPFLYLPDGRVVPACVVEAQLYAGAPAGHRPLIFSSHLIGGGYPVLTEVQGREHVGSIACLVSDGERYYGLTNQHVAGEPEQPIFTRIAGAKSRIGVAAEGSLRKADFAQIYPGLPGRDTKCNLDLGLIEVDDVSQWTSQIFGLGVLGAPIEFDVTTASLDWISCKVVAYGAASGRLDGEIKALFYRYRSIGGTDYVSDFLIGGRGKAALPTAPGDSGTLWCIDPEMFAPAGDGAQQTNPRGRGKEAARRRDAAALRPAGESGERFRPLAVQWGGQKLSDATGTSYTQFALATSIAVACRELDVEIVADLNAEHTQYWGAVGHYKIAERAIEMLGADPLGRFLGTNLPQLTYDKETLATGEVHPDARHFVPLADVPDAVWKTNINRGGKAARAQENWNHYADMDLPGEDGRLLFDLCGDPASQLDIAAWIAFYGSSPLPKASKSRTLNMGALPFRVWQTFEALREHRREGDQERFLCAAGVLAHYIGDACQPLHSSMHADGLDGASTGVHGFYEEKMVDVHAEDLSADLDAFDPAALGPALPLVNTGHAAGLAAVELMRRVHGYLPPTRICDTFEQLGDGGKSRAVLEGLWEAVRADTVRCIVDGTRTLAMLWRSAFQAGGNGKAFSGSVGQARLQGIYEDPDFLPSLHLKNLDPADYPLPGAAAAPAAAGAKAVTATAVKGGRGRGRARQRPARAKHPAASRKRRAAAR